jgi:hypothetical protein
VTRNISVKRICRTLGIKPMASLFNLVLFKIACWLAYNFSMQCKVDSTYAGSQAAALEEAASRFCKAHPAEQWHISGVLVQEGLNLNASDGKRFLTEKVLPPVLDMPRSIFEALESFRNQA